MYIICTLIISIYIDTHPEYYIFMFLSRFNKKNYPKRNKLLRMQRWKSWKTLRRRQGVEAPVASNVPKEKLRFGNIWEWNMDHRLEAKHWFLGWFAVLLTFGEWLLGNVISGTGTQFVKWINKPTNNSSSTEPQIVLANPNEALHRCIMIFFFQPCWWC